MTGPVVFSTGYEPAYDFTIDLENGELGEHSVAKLLTIESVEVKTKSRDDNTFYIEYQQNARNRGVWTLSGISTTTATHWAFTYCDRRVLAIFETRLLYEAAKRAYHNDKWNCTEIGGDNPTRGVLITMDEIVETSKLLD